MTQGPREKPSDFGGNPDHVMLGYRVGVGVIVGLWLR